MIVFFQYQYGAFPSISISVKVHISIGIGIPLPTLVSVFEQILIQRFEPILHSYQTIQTELHSIVHESYIQKAL